MGPEDAGEGPCPRPVHMPWSLPAQLLVGRSVASPPPPPQTLKNEANRCQCCFENPFGNNTSASLPP